MPENLTPAPEPDDEIVRDELERAEAKRRTGRARLIGIAVSVVVIGVVFAFLLPKIANYRDVWKVVQGMSWQWIAALIVAAALDVATFAPPWMAALPGLGYLHAARVTLGSTALSMVAPGGAAVGMATSFAMLKAWGIKGRPVGLAVALTGIWNQFFILAFPILAVGALLADGGQNKTLELIALIALAVLCVVVTGFAIGLQSPRRALKVGNWAASAVSGLKRLIRKRPVDWTGAAFVRFRAETIDLLRRRWHILTIATLANQLADFLLMVVAIRATGITSGEVDLVEAFAAWALVRVLGSLPITPGGIGVVELGLTGALVGFGATNAEAVAAALVYRFLQIVPILLLGLLSAATWKIGKPKVAAPAVQTR